MAAPAQRNCDASPMLELPGFRRTRSSIIYCRGRRSARSSRFDRVQRRLRSSLASALPLGAAAETAAALFEIAGLGEKTRTDGSHLRTTMKDRAPPGRNRLRRRPSRRSQPDGGAPGDVPGDLSARSRTRLAPPRPRPEHGPGDDGDRARGRRCQARRPDTTHTPSPRHFAHRPRRPVRRAAPGAAAAARAALPREAWPRRLNRRRATTRVSPRLGHPVGQYVTSLSRLKTVHRRLIGEATKKLHHLRLRLDVLGVQ